MTPEQLTTLGAYIATVPAWAALPNNSDTAYAIAAELNQPADPAWTVWRSDVARDDVSGEGFDWTQVDNTTVGKARIWEWMFNNQQRVINPSKINVRAGIDEAWKGTAAMLAVRAAIYIHCKRKANRAEKLFATGAGTDASPSTMSFEGTMSYTEVQMAMGW